MREKRKRRWEIKGKNEKKIRIRNLKNNKIKKIKIDNNKNIAKNFYVTVVGSVWSV